MDYAEYIDELKKKFMKQFNEPDRVKVKMNPETYCYRTMVEMNDIISGLGLDNYGIHVNQFGNIVAVTVSHLDKECVILINYKDWDWDSFGWGYEITKYLNRKFCGGGE